MEHVANKKEFEDSVPAEEWVTHNRFMTTYNIYIHM